MAVNLAANAFTHRIAPVEQSRFAANERNLQTQLRDARQNIDAVGGAISAFHGAPTGLEGLKAKLSAYESTYVALLSSSEQFRVAEVELWPIATDPQSIRSASRYTFTGFTTNPGSY